jgi:Zn-finger nucleic acid-binding protein
MMGELAKVCILYCAKCGGMMIPMGIFPDLIEALRGTTDGAPESAIIQPQADSEDLQRKIDCPGCHRRMETHRYGGPGNVIIDSCETCSRIWLDRGELMRIVHAPDHRVESTAALDSVRCENSHVTPDYLDMLFG